MTVKKQAKKPATKQAKKPAKKSAHECCGKCQHHDSSSGLTAKNIVEHMQKVVAVHEDGLAKAYKIIEARVEAGQPPTDDTFVSIVKEYASKHKASEYEALVFVSLVCHEMAQRAHQMKELQGLISRALTEVKEEPADPATKSKFH